MKQNTMVIDLDRCIGCMGCQVACKLENDVALGSTRIRVMPVGPLGKYPDLKMYFLPVMCQQCEDPSCVRVCPTGAIYKREEDGDVVIDKDMCIGCKSCTRACPYDLNNFNSALRVMDKCTQCIHLQEIGEKPACVKNCAGRAMYFGDINDPDSEVSRVIREAGPENVHSLRDEGNKPTVRYILRNVEWQDVLPQELSEMQRGRRK